MPRLALSMRSPFFVLCTAGGALAAPSGSNEGDVYDLLYRFFERHCDNGGVMSRRYFAPETGGKAAP